MAILNVTPDSFSDGGLLTTPQAAAEAAERAVRAGADMLDVGAESTRPGAERVSAMEQIDRLRPAVQAIRARIGPGVPITADTTRAETAAAALEAGATAINDVSAGAEDADMLPLVARHGVGIVLMHRLRPPGEDRYSDRYEQPPVYHDVFAEVRAFLIERAEAAQRAGVGREAIVIDPGLGFGKTVEQNLELIRRTNELAKEGFPVLSGISRKSFTARAAGDDPGAPSRPPSQRLSATLGLSVFHLNQGARIFRVHDVIEHIEALKSAWAALNPARARSAT